MSQPLVTIVTPTKKLGLTRGKVTLLDESDFVTASRHKWSATLIEKRWYVIGRIDGKLTFLHRWILKAPKGVEIDHINGDGLDNRRQNLRFATSSDNKCNRGPKPNCSSRFKGVTKLQDSAKGEQRWWARVKKNGKVMSLGVYRTEELAAHAYNFTAVQVHGEFVWVNEL